MKNCQRFVMGIALMLVAGPAFSQIVSDKTNAIAVSFSEPGVNRSIPTINWIFPRLEYTNSPENMVHVRAKVQSPVPIKEVVISLQKTKNGSAKGSRVIELDATGKGATVDQDLRLTDGENWIEIKVETQEGAIAYDYRSIRVGLDAIADAVLLDRKDYALLIATDRYDSWNDLVNPVFDAQSIGKELEERYGFEVEILENANSDEIMTKLRDYAQLNYKPQDQLFIFFAGHGQYDEVFGEGYLVARNSVLNDESKNSYISYNRIRSNINNIPAEHILLMMDVCFGGTFDEVLASQRGAYEETDDRQYLVRKLSKKTRKYLTSGSKEYVSDGVRGQHSPFAQNVLEAFRSNGGEDRILILDEIKLYMERLQTTPRFGEFGDDEAGSDFVFVAQ